MDTPTHLPLARMSRRGRHRQFDPRHDTRSLEGGANPFSGQNHLPASGAGNTVEVLNLRLQGQILLGRALEVENQQYRDELHRLQERVQTQSPPVAAQPSQALTNRRSLAERIDGAERQAPPHAVTHGRVSAFGARLQASLPPAVVVRPVDIHPRFLPLGDNFQEGGTGGPMFTRPLDWPNAIQTNPSARPRGIRLWGSQPANLDDLYVYTQLGQVLYGGNRPPGRRDPVDPQRPWRAIEAAFFRGTVTIILQPHLFAEVRDRLTPEQHALYRQPFLALVEDPTHLDPRDIIQHLVRMGITENWLQLDAVIGYARSYLRDWARHRSEITTDTEMGELFLSLYPEGIPHQNDRRFIEDAAAEGTWIGDAAVDTPMDEEDEPPPLEPQTPSQGTPRTATPEDERLDWGEDDL